MDLFVFLTTCCFDVSSINDKGKYVPRVTNDKGKYVPRVTNDSDKKNTRGPIPNLIAKILH